MHTFQKWNKILNYYELVIEFIDIIIQEAHDFFSARVNKGRKKIIDFQFKKNYTSLAA